MDAAELARRVPLEAVDDIPAESLPAVMIYFTALQGRAAARLAASPAPPRVPPEPQAVEQHPMTQEETAERYRMPLRTIRRLTRTGRVPSYQLGRNRMIRPADLDAYLGRCRDQGVKVGTILDV
jgi:excisionase family DNA binding protein